eukprot:4762532-Pyramimonas_sp.AAC.1
MWRPETCPCGALRRVHVAISPRASWQRWWRRQRRTCGSRRPSSLTKRCAVIGLSADNKPLGGP